jgi:hypothetical protein
MWSLILIVYLAAKIEVQHKHLFAGRELKQSHAKRVTNAHASPLDKLTTDYFLLRWLQMSNENVTVPAMPMRITGP